MSLVVGSIEVVLRWLSAIGGLGTLVYAIYNMLIAQTRPTGLHTGAANKVLRTPYLLIASLLFAILGFLLWKPLPLQLTWQMRLWLALAGVIIFLTGLVLYLWGLRTLGGNFNVASGFGVRLVQAHQLVTNGPYSYVRHPMYLAIILAFWGGLLLYRTWTMLVFAVIMLGLIYRAHSEEIAMAQAFGEAWDVYKRRVRGWIPHIESLGRKNFR